MCLLALACSEDEKAPLPELELRGAQALDRCPDENFDECDASKESCQNRLARIACCAFECDDPLSTPVGVIDEAAYRAQLEAWYEENPEERANDQRFENVLVALNLTAEGSFSAERRIEFSIEHFVALYEYEGKSITLIDRGAPEDALETDVTLVHEMIHALQDDRHDLSSLHERTTTWDESTYLSALIEGEARLHEYRVLAGMQGLAETSVDLTLATTSVREFADEWLFEQEDVYLEGWPVLQYSYGIDYARRLFERDGVSELRAEFEATPASTYRLLAEVWDAPPLSASDILHIEIPTPAPGLAVPVLTGSFGPWLVYVFTRAQGIDGVDAKSVSLSWRGDTIVVYELASGETAGRWDVTFDDEASASQFLKVAEALSNVTAIDTADPATISLSILGDAI